MKLKVLMDLLPTQATERVPKVTKTKKQRPNIVTECW